MTCLGIAIGAHVILNKRPDLTDPATIAKLPPIELRDSEVEHLVRAAFSGTRSVHIESEAAPSIDVSDPAILRRLSHEFAVGRDAEQLPMYRHPGLEYTILTFAGNDDVSIRFTGPKEAVLMGAGPGRFRRFDVRTQFAKSLADLLRLELAPKPFSKRHDSEGSPPNIDLPFQR